MLTDRQIFLQNIGQTSDNPLLLEIEMAKGIYLYDKTGKQYIDLCSGVSVSNLGHRNEKVIQAVKNQLDKYMHLMVYGEYIQAPQVKFAKLLTNNLPTQLSSVYFTNSGSEATEGALKLSKRFTGRSEIISMKNAYHGSTHGALSVLGDEYFKRAFRPLLPDIRFIEFNNVDNLQQITNRTACVILEPIQSEAGVILPTNNYLTKLRLRCTQTGTLLIFDEVQTGFGRTGNLFAFQKYNIIPDILTIAKSMGGGLPLGAFVSSKEIMDTLKSNPMLGHITTFGGHPVSCAAAHASLEILLSENIIPEVIEKGNIFRQNLTNSKIKSINGEGLLLAVELESKQQIIKFIDKAVEVGLLTDIFLFAQNKFRIGPPSIITKEEIIKTCKLINKAIEVL